MPSVNLRGLRNTKQLKAWLKAGKTVELRERDKTLGRIVPDLQSPAHPISQPDFAARRKAIFGERTFPVVEDLVADRDDRV
jgi:hypothetical protein